MNRTTKQQCYSVFFHLAGALGKTLYLSEGDFSRMKKANEYFSPPSKLTHDYRTIGAWHLDFDHGTRIVEMDSAGGGISYPLGSTVFTMTEFYYAVHFALNALRLEKEVKPT